MRRGNRTLFSRLGLGRVVLAVWSCWTCPLETRAQLPVGEQLLPATTKLFVTCRNVREFVAARDKTLLGKLGEDPQMKPFLDDLEAQLERHVTDAEVKVGLKLSDLKGICDGQLTVAVAPFPPDEAGKPRTGTLLLVDVTGHVPQAEQARAKLAASLVENKAQPAAFQTPGGAKGTVYAVPPRNEGGRTAEVAEAFQVQGESTVWLIGSPLLVAEVSANLAGATGAKLAANEAFVKIMQQSAPAPGEPAAHIVAFVEPLGFSAALRAYEPPGTRHKPDGLAVLRGAGFDALQGVGGQMAFAVGDYGLLTRVSVLAPQPWQHSMNMLTTLPGPDFAPQPWVADNVAGYATLYWDMLKAFDTFGPLFDGFLEQEGIWKDVVESMHKDPDGPQVDVRAEFFALLGKRVTAVVDRNLPNATDSSRYVLAFELADPKNLPRVIETMKKAFANDPTVEHSKLGDLDVYKVIATEEVPANAPNQEGVVDGQRVIVSSFFTAANGHFFIASHVDMLQKVLGPPPAQGLATAPDYVAVTAELGKFLPKEKPQLAGLAFQRLDELLQVDYELFRAGKLTWSQTILGHLLKERTEEGTEPAKPPLKLDGTKLPPFPVFKKYLSPFGLLLRNTDDGWQFVALTHEKAPPATPAAAPVEPGK